MSGESWSAMEDGVSPESGKHAKRQIPGNKFGHGMIEGAMTG